MEEYIQKTQLYYVSELSKAAHEYLKVGLELFHKQQSYYYANPQAPLGILAIAIELMLKAFICANNFTLIFKDIPLQLKALISNPSNIPKSFKYRQYDIDIRSYIFKTLELNECISAFYIFKPKLKHLKSHFRFLSKYRNASVHLALPSFHKYELDRTAFLALELAKCLKEEEIGFFKYYLISKEDKHFLENFHEERLERVRKMIEEAQKKSKTIDHKGAFISIDDWGLFVTNCPICNSDGVLTGETELSGEENEDRELTPALFFFADSFECTECGLSLKDPDELNLAGIEISYDRDEDIDRWFAEMGDHDY